MTDDIVDSQDLSIKATDMLRTARMELQIELLRWQMAEVLERLAKAEAKLRD